MREIEIPLGSAIDAAFVEKTIDDALRRAKLTVTLRGTLKKYPGCIHWHVKNGLLAGTLEVTFWPAAGRAWLTIQDGRRAAWIDDYVAPLLTAIQEQITD